MSRAGTLRLTLQHVDPVQKGARVSHLWMSNLAEQDLELRLCYTHSWWSPVLDHARKGAIAFWISFLTASWSPKFIFAGCLCAVPGDNGTLASTDQHCECLQHSVLSSCPSLWALGIFVLIWSSLVILKKLIMKKRMRLLNILNS